MWAALYTPRRLLGRKIPMLALTKAMFACHAVTQCEPQPAERIFTESARNRDIGIYLLLIVVVGIEGAVIGIFPHRFLLFP